MPSTPNCRAVEPSSRQLSRHLTIEQLSRQAVEALNHQAAELVSRQLGGPTHQQILHKISTYVTAHRTTHHAAHGMRDRQGLPALCGLAAEENFQGKTGQRGSAANFLPAQRQHKKKAATRIACVAGVCLKNLRGKPDSAEALPIFCRPKNASIKKRPLVPMVLGGRATTLGTRTRTPRQVMHWEAPWTPPTVQP